MWGGLGVGRFGCGKVWVWKVWVWKGTRVERYACGRLSENMGCGKVTRASGWQGKRVGDWDV